MVGKRRRKVEKPRRKRRLKTALAADKDFVPVRVNNAHGKTVGLCMIVKNESQIILRCLRSVRDLIDYVLVADTGSTDGTQAIIRNYLAEEALPGEVIAEPWQDFAHNRSRALAKLRGRTEIDYALVMDADDTLVFTDDFDAERFRQSLEKDYYHVEIRLEPNRFWRAQLLSNRLPFGYKGVLHEFVAGPLANASSGTISDFYVKVGNDGFRSRNPNKYGVDVATLESALSVETDEFIRARYTFYLAQSWMYAGEKEKALQTYLHRAELGQFYQEVCLSLYYAAQLKDILGYPNTDVIGTFLAAFEADPNRAEPLHGAMDYCRRHKNPYLAHMIGKYALTLPKPFGALFEAPWIYDYGVLEEFSIAAFHSGHYRDCAEAIERLLMEGKIPEAAHARLKENARLAIQNLKAPIPARA